MNSTLFSFNKVKEIEEYKPMIPPDTIYNEESNNRSFQSYIPEIYDLDRIEFNYLKCQRNSTPTIKNNINFNNIFYESTFINQREKIDKYVESLPINIYNNEKQENIKYDKYKEIEFIRDNMQNSDAYQKQKNKIDDDINNNLNIKKELLENKNNKNLVSYFDKKENVLIQKNDISSPNLNIDLLNSQNIITNININKNNIKKIEKKKTIGQKSIQSDITTYNYNNMMKRDPNNENIIIINTSLYKRKKSKKGNNLNKISSQIINRNSFNSFLKFEESSQDQSLSNFKLNKKERNKKEEIINPFKNYNDNIKNNIKIENSKLDKSNEDSFILINSKIEQNNISNSESNINLKVDENDNKFNYEDKMYNNIFTMNKNNINNIKLKSPTINKMNYFNNEKEEGINLKLSYSPIKLNSYNNNKNGQILCKKPSTYLISSNTKYDFDFPKIIKEYSKDDINKSKSFKNRKEDKTSIKENEKNEVNFDIVNIKLNNLKKILKKDGFFNILTFLDCYDLMNLLQTNKSIILLINKSISNAYYHIIKKNIKNYKNDFELLKSSLVYSKVKNSLKIDFVINIRFLKNIYNNEIESDNKSQKEMEPKCFQILYFYKYFKSINPKMKLKTKENTKQVNMYDCYTYDLYSENDETPNIYINKEPLIFNNNINAEEKLVFIQPILPFKVKDKGIINLEIYSSNNNFINPSSIIIALKNFDLKNYIENLKEKGNINLRICEYENNCFHWKEITDDRIININFREIINKIKYILEPCFRIINISYESIGYFIFKINLVAIKAGKIENNKLGDYFGINLIIRRKKEVVENEIKKNNLLLERREIYELRVGDTITLYFSTYIPKKNNRKK